MTVDASLVYGVRLYRSADGVTYTEVADLKELGSPGDPVAPDVDVTPLTPSVAAREFKAGLLNSGEMEFKQFWNKTRFTALRAILRVGYYWRVVFPDNASPALASRVDFAGYLNRCTTSPMTDPDEPITIDCKVKVTGAITFTEGS